MTGTGRGGAVACAAMLVLAWTAAVAAPTPAQKCSSAKIKAAGKAVFDRTKCERKALLKGIAIDPECVSKADGKLESTFLSTESKFACTVSGDANDVQANVDACISAFDAAIDGDNFCEAAKFKAVGKKTSGKAKCWQKAYLVDGTADPACLALVETKFNEEIMKADTFGPCTDTAVVLEGLVDDCIDSLAVYGPPDACELNDNTTETATQHPDGCYVLDRDASACDSARTTAGLSGFWLEFSCRVTLTNGMSAVTAQSDGLPDYLSNYFDETDDCWESYTGATQNPNLIATQAYTVSFPNVPDTTAQSMMGQAVVGMAVNGVPIFGNFAAPMDNIFDEAATFDRCGAHPQNTGKYHYHSEPYAISYDDPNFVGVMRDGYPIYGRRDSNYALPMDLDAYGGHTSVTPHSPVTPVYHYHVNEQVNPENAMDTQWFLTTGTFRGTPGATCTGCN